MERGKRYKKNNLSLHETHRNIFKQSETQNPYPGIRNIIAQNYLVEEAHLRNVQARKRLVNF